MKNTYCSSVLRVFCQPLAVDLTKRNSIKHRKHLTIHLLCSITRLTNNILARCLTQLSGAALGI